MIRTIITGVGVTLMSIFGVVTLTMWKCLRSGAATKRLTYEKASVEVHTVSWQPAYYGILSNYNLLTRIYPTGLFRST